MRKLMLVSGSLLVFAVVATAPAAQAAYIVTLTQDGNNVVANGSGTIDTAGLEKGSGGNTISSLRPEQALIVTGPESVVPTNTYVFFDINGPDSFGTGGFTRPDSGDGDEVGILGSITILVPAGYVSGSALTSTSTFDNQTFSSLGVTPGTYVYRFGFGENADTFTVDITAAPTPPSVPEPASLALFGTGLLGLGMIRRRKRG